MKKKISFKLFLTVLWRGISQVFMSVCRLFGYKEGTAFGKVIWRICVTCFTILFAIFTSTFLYFFVKELVLDKWIGRDADEVSYYCSEQLSNNIQYQETYRLLKGRIYDVEKKCVTLSEVDWVVTNEDTLAVFAQGDRRGYLNRFTGEVVLPAIYSKAWIFSEGVAAVEKDGNLCFIDRAGNVVIDNNLEAYYRTNGYAFHGGYCIVENPVNGRKGLIDKEGNWALSPIYSDVLYNAPLWIVEKDQHFGAFTEKMDTLFACDNLRVFISEGAIEVLSSDYEAKRFDFEGNVLADFVIDEVEDMYYSTTDVHNGADSEGDFSFRTIQAVSKCRRYRVFGGAYFSDHYGLIDRNGHRVTPPDYTSIEAIGEDLYLCMPHGCIINGKGQIVE